ncbi:MAG: hypothetical protein ACHQDB_03425 [Steroidobacterales bacterium]
MKGSRSDSASQSLAFRQRVGLTAAAAAIAPEDYGFDFDRFSSEGVWAFCRFTGTDISAARIGFQHGAFDLSCQPQVPDRSYLQLHLEVMTQDGAVLWLPSGQYASENVVSERRAMHASLENAGREIFHYRGWPGIDCRFRSEDDSLEAVLRFDLGSVTVLPDGILPQCVFAMWESMGVVSGTIRCDARTVAVDGKVFFDHTRIVRRRSAAPTRGMSLYTTMYFEDGSGVFGYWTLDERNAPIKDYCFGVYLDPVGSGHFLASATLSDLITDQDGIASSWRVHYRHQDFDLTLQIVAQQHQIRRAWGSPNAPTQRAAFSIIPLVLDGSAQLRRARRALTPLRGFGLAEYYSAALWRANSKAARGAG